MSNIMAALFAFVALTALDFVWGAYISAVAKAPPLNAALLSIPVYAIGMGATIQIVQHPWILIPACAGCFVGTFASVWLHRRKEKKDA